ncbi:hypothetical protein GUJ93_ZPchr0004g38708 [Zizania palustris]|uniref:Uncharacterized protein n=1 Tax=Zizania palustris TaxID=103762 RepID=A0A8J5SZS4_ZIZPA|nr:hypothetical protein GUJ93_ZPchr0004g38708 [Zizania palustris]
MPLRSDKEMISGFVYVRFGSRDTTNDTAATCITETTTSSACGSSGGSWSDNRRGRGIDSSTSIGETRCGRQVVPWYLEQREGALAGERQVKDA